MDPLKPLNRIKTKKTTKLIFKNLLLKAGGVLELAVILSLWALIFLSKLRPGGLNLSDVLAYFLVGNIITLITGYLIERIIAYDIANDESKLLVYRPWNYFSRVVAREFTRYLPPFLLIASAYFLILYFFVNSFTINDDPYYLAVMMVMIALAFFSEFLIAYLFQLLIFWTIQSQSAYNIIIRLKKILAGTYFPLSLLPPAALSASIAMPFAYSFFMPTELYLKNISLKLGLIGLGIQALWLAILYSLIRIIWYSKIERDRNMTTK